RTGDIMARTTNDLAAVRQLLGPAIMYSANTIVFTAAALPFMIRISPKLTLCAFVPLPIASVLVQYFGARIHRRFERIQAMFSDISAKAQENFSGARLIRAFVQEEAEIASFETANHEYIRRSLYLVRLMAMLWPTLEFVLGLSLMITLLVGGHEVVEHRISVGQFTAFIVYMVQLTWPMIAVGWVVNLFQRGTASIAFALMPKDKVAVSRNWAAYLYVKDVDVLYAEYEALGVELPHPPETRVYNCREFVVDDPDGHIIAFGQVLNPDPLGPGLGNRVGRDRKTAPP
ncbi:MAG: hypothetical protein J0I57_02750, partial [Hyphomicrobium sp.]|nr:hypothetical protein [Hyphomicrobium sp.]